MTSIKLPSEWKFMVLGDFAEVKYGKARPKDSGSIPVIGSGGEYGRTSKPLIDYSTIVIGRKGTAGLAWLQAQPCWPSDTTFYLQWKNKVIDHNYLFYHLQGKPLSGEHAKTTLPSILKQDLEKYPLIVPPLPEQRAIARALRAVQGAREARLREMALEKERKAALMEHLFTHGTRGEVTKMTEIGEMPESWQVVSLNELIVDGPQNGIYKPLELYGDGTQIIRIDDFDNDGIFINNEFKRVRLSQEEIEKYRINENDIIINRVNSLSHLGKSALISNLNEAVVFESNMMKFHANEGKISPEFLLRYLITKDNKDRIRNIAKRAVAQSSINQGDVKSLRIPLPRGEEQQEISKVLNANDSKIAALDHEARLLQELFQAMLEELMSGRLPAGALVEDAA